MNMSLQEIDTFANAFKGTEVSEVAIAAPTIYLSYLKTKDLKNVQIWAQNIAAYEKGAYTGETAVYMLKDLGVTGALVGHSERRTYFGDTNAIVAQKMELLANNGLKAVLCIGETIEERNENKHFEVVRTQIITGLEKLSKDQRSLVVLAYEPVWAIGTGVTASSDQAQEMHAFIRDLIQEIWSESDAQKIQILYGGSCKPSNAEELFGKADVDGGLIGGAALNAEDFQGIIDASEK